MAHTKRALIVGGSLGGLFAATLLRQAGWDVLVFERTRGDLSSRGAGIGTHHEMFDTMRKIGIDVDSEPLGVLAAERACFDHTGAVLATRAFPELMSSWAKIYRLLQRALPDACYRPAMQIEAVEQTPDGVTAIFSDGTRVEGDVLVGADGVRSTLRGLCFGAVEPRYAGYVVWRGLLEENEVPAIAHQALFERMSFFLTEDGMALGYPVPGRADGTRPGERGFNWAWYRPADEATALPLLCTDATGRRHGVSIAPPLIRPEVIAEVKAAARATLAPQFVAVVESTPQIFFQPIFDYESPRMVAGRVALLGDAAFVARPHVGAGVVKASLDAESLTAALAETPSDPAAALLRYEAKRLAFGRAMVARARWLGAYIEGYRLAPEARRAGMSPDPETVMREIAARLQDIPEGGVPA